MNTVLANQTTVNSVLLAQLHTGTSNPEAIAKYEAELMDIAMRVIRGDLSDMERVLSNQVINLNNLFTRFAISADTHAAEGHVIEAEKYSKMALSYANSCSKGIKQLADMKKPKKGSVYIRTVNQQVNNPEPAQNNAVPDQTFF